MTARAVEETAPSPQDLTDGLRTITGSRLGTTECRAGSHGPGPVMRGPGQTEGGGRARHNASRAAPYAWSGGVA